MTRPEDRLSNLSDSFWEDEDGSTALRAEERGARPTGHPFVADADASELDDRNRPSPKWAVRTCELSRNHLVFYSRRMIYEGRQVMLAIHLVDDRPVVLGGKVVSCDYEGGGRHRIDVDLVHIPPSEPLARWAESPGPRRRVA